MKYKKIIKYISKIASVLILISILSINISAKEGDVSLGKPSKYDEGIKVPIIIDSGTKNIGAFNIILEFDDKLVSLNMDEFTNGVEKGKDIQEYIIASNKVDNSVKIAATSGSDYSNGNAINIANIYFKVEGKITDLSFINIKINELVDSDAKELDFIKNPDAFSEQKLVNINSTKNNEFNVNNSNNSYGFIENDRSIGKYLKNNFNSCSTIDNLNDSSYGEGFESSLKDINSNKNISNIKKLEKTGIINGDVNKNFNGNSGITRAEILAILLKTHCYSFENPSNIPFIDVNKDSWQYNVVSKGYQMGIVKGDINVFGEDVFRPNDKVTRAEAIAMLMGIGIKDDLSTSSNSGFIDIEASWQEKVLSKALELNIVAKNDSKFRPQEEMKRNDFISYLFNTITLYR